LGVCQPWRLKPRLSLLSLYSASDCFRVTTHQHTWSRSGPSTMSSTGAQPIPLALIIEDQDNPDTRRPFSRPRPRHRPRPVLSCLRCRSRKIKCDRLVPCNQCTSTGHDRECSYNDRPKLKDSSRTVNGSISRQGSIAASIIDVENSNHQPAIAPPTTLLGTATLKTLISLQERLQKLEQLCTTQSHAPVKISHGENVAIETTPPLSQLEGRMSIKTSGPRYHSESYKKSLLHHVSPTFTSGPEMYLLKSLVWYCRPLLP